MHLNYIQINLLHEVINNPDGKFIGQDRDELNYLASLGLVESLLGLRYEVTDKGHEHLRAKKIDKDILTDAKY